MLERVTSDSSRRLQFLIVSQIRCSSADNGIKWYQMVRAHGGDDCSIQVSITALQLCKSPVFISTRASIAPLFFPPITVQHLSHSCFGLRLGYFELSLFAANEWLKNFAFAVS